jgi:hypothetical protein
MVDSNNKCEGNEQEVGSGCITYQLRIRLENWRKQYQTSVKKVDVHVTIDFEQKSNAWVKRLCTQWSNWSAIKHTPMPSPSYQNMVSLIVGFPIRRRQSKFINIAMCQTCTLDKFLDVAKSITGTPLSLQISCQLSFPIVGMKCLPYLLLHWNQLPKFACRILGIYRIHKF